MFHSTEQCVVTLVVRLGLMKGSLAPHGEMLDLPQLAHKRPIAVDQRCINGIIARVVDTRIALQIVSEAHPDLWLYRVTYSGFDPDDGRASGAKSSSSGSLSGSDSTRSGVSQSLSGRHTKRAF